MAEFEDFGQCLEIQKCPQCNKLFKLGWNDYSDKPQTLFIRACPSGGIYNVFIRCPYCDYEEEL
jgi:uncharacterized C2H2 Zn-finger protein